MTLDQIIIMFHKLLVQSLFKFNDTNFHNYSLNSFHDPEFLTLI